MLHQKDWEAIVRDSLKAGRSFLAMVAIAGLIVFVIGCIVAAG